MACNNCQAFSLLSYFSPPPPLSIFLSQILLTMFALFLPCVSSILNTMSQWGQFKVLVAHVTNHFSLVYISLTWYYFFLILRFFFLFLITINLIFFLSFPFPPWLGGWILPKSFLTATAYCLLSPFFYNCRTPSKWGVEVGGYHVVAAYALNEWMNEYHSLYPLSLFSLYYHIWWRRKSFLLFFRRFVFLFTWSFLLLLSN